MYLAFRKCKNECKILKIILEPDFCPPKPEIARFFSGFRLNTFRNFNRSLNKRRMSPAQTITTSK